MISEALLYFSTRANFLQLSDILKQKLLLSPDYADDLCEAVNFVEFLSDSLEIATNAFAGDVYGGVVGGVFWWRW